MERDASAAGPLVTGFSGTGFRIGEARYGALLLTAGEALDWAPPPLADLSVDDLAAILGDTPEFVLIGTGAALVRPAPALAAALEERGIGIEQMDSRAAARAWGVLRGEGRAVAAALYPLDA